MSAIEKPARRSYNRINANENIYHGHSLRRFLQPVGVDDWVDGFGDSAGDSSGDSICHVQPGQIKTRTLELCRLAKLGVGGLGVDVSQL